MLKNAKKIKKNALKIKNLIEYKIKNYFFINFKNAQPKRSVLI